MAPSRKERQEQAKREKREKNKWMKERKEERARRYESGLHKMHFQVRGALSEDALQRLFNGRTRGPSTLLNIKMVGLEGAGKTTILQKLNLGDIETTFPTAGFKVQTAPQQNNFKFTVWNVGGEETLRAVWRPYLQNTQGLIFVVDASDGDRIVEVRQELQKLLEEDELRDAALLVFANKQDLPNAMNEDELTNKLGLHEITNRRWRVDETVGTVAYGLVSPLLRVENMLPKK